MKRAPLPALGKRELEETQTACNSSTAAVYRSEATAHNGEATGPERSAPARPL